MWHSTRWYLLPQSSAAVTLMKQGRTKPRYNQVLKAQNTKMWYKRLPKFDGYVSCTVLALFEPSAQHNKCLWKLDPERHSQNVLWYHCGEKCSQYSGHFNRSFQSYLVLPRSWINTASNPIFTSELTSLVLIDNINWEISNLKKILVLILLWWNSSSRCMDLVQTFGSGSGPGQLVQVGVQVSVATTVSRAEFQLTFCLHQQKPKFCRSSLNVSYLGFIFSMDEKKEVSINVPSWRCPTCTLCTVHQRSAEAAIWIWKEFENYVDNLHSPKVLQLYFHFLMAF